jgi:outer membrane protein assembly complex protein YaeT
MTRCWKASDRALKTVRNSAAVIIAAALLLAPIQSRAQNKQPDKPEIVKLTLKGVHVLKKDELMQSISTSQSSCNSVILKPICWVSKSKFVYSKQYLDHDELKRDVLRIQVFYWKRGYRDTQVDTTVIPRGAHKVAVTLNVHEGEPTMVTSVVVNQDTATLKDRTIAKRVVIGENSPLNLIRVDSSRAFLAQSLWEKGYADAEVDTAIVVNDSAHSATVTFTLNPKWRTTVEDIVVSGNEGVSEGTIRKSLTFKEGEIFRRSEMLKSQRALYESNLFKRASIEPRPPIDPFLPDSAKIVVVTVTESPPREARLSAGFNTVDFFQVEGRFTHYNLGGGARHLDVQAAVGNLLAGSLNGRGLFKNVSTVVTSDRSRYFAPTYTASVDMRQPWFGSTHNEIALGLFTHRRSAPGIYVDRGYGTSATFTRELIEGGPASANYRFEISRVDAGDVYFCVNYGVCDTPTLGALRKNQRLSPLSLSATVDRTNDPFSPNRGYRASFGAEHASAFTLSDFRYNRATIDGAAFKQVRKRGAIGAHLVIGWVNALGSTADAVGVISTTNESVLHPRKRFYSGGSHSVRGFGENQLGPRVLTIPAQTLQKHDSLNAPCFTGTDITKCDPNAAKLATRDFDPRPLGGNVDLEGSIEGRFPIWRALSGAAFIDAGVVTQKINKDLPRRRGAITPGFGVRYLSPVGPIRADIGINPGTRESLPVVTEQIIGGQKKLVTLDKRRIYAPGKKVFDRLVLHLSIGEAF